MILAAFFVVSILVLAWSIVREDHGDPVRDSVQEFEAARHDLGRIVSGKVRTPNSSPGRNPR